MEDCPVCVASQPGSLDKYIWALPRVKHLALIVSEAVRLPFVLIGSRICCDGFSDRAAFSCDL